MCEELPALAVEESIGGEACGGVDGAAKSIAQRTNDANVGEVGVDEFSAPGKDPLG